MGLKCLHQSEGTARGLHIMSHFLGSYYVKPGFFKLYYLGGVLENCWEGDNA